MGASMRTIGFMVARLSKHTLQEVGLLWGGFAADILYLSVGGQGNVAEGVELRITGLWGMW